MANFHITQGKNLKIKGSPNKEIVKISLPKQIAVQPSDFRGVKPRMLVKAGDSVKAGDPLFADKIFEKIKIVSPISGKVVVINRGAKRVVLEVVVEVDEQQTYADFKKHSSSEMAGLSKEVVVQNLLDGGMWNVIRQRPFSSFADPSQFPKSIFVHAVNTEPLSLDVDFVLEGQENDFQAGLDILGKLTKGDVHLCVSKDSKSAALTQSQNVQIHQFSGVHPSGNVSTHIHCVDPINKGETVWYVEAQDVVRIARLFLTGNYSAERIVAATGEGVKNRVYVKTIIGAPLSAVVQGSDLEGMRCLTGSVLSGREIGKNGFVGHFDSQVTVIPEGGNRELLGWLMPGINKYTFSNTYLSSLLPKDEYSLDTDTNGADRAIVFNHLYDDLVPLDIMIYFLLKAVISQDIEEAERLGILECEEEDFALCTFACPSKTDVGGIIREGLELIQKEG